MLREYEFTLITKGDLPDAERIKVVEGYEKLMTADGGQILKKDEWGLKRLHFPIKKQYRGYYINYDFVGTKENLAEMERLMRIDDNVLRYLAIRLDESSTGVIDIDARKREIAKAEAAAREAEEKRKQGRV